MSEESDVPKAAKYTFSSAHGIFSRIDHVLGQRSSPSKFKKIEIISTIISDHNGMKIESNYKKKNPGKSTNTWRLNNMLLNNEWVINEIREEIKRYLERMKMRTQ